MSTLTEAKKTENVPVVFLPGKFSLTEKGMLYCVKNKIPTHDFVTCSGNKATGFIWKGYKTNLVQQFFFHLLLDRLETEHIELLSKRREIIETTKLLFYTYLYTQFKPEITRIILESDFVTSLSLKSRTFLSNGKISFNPAIVNQYIKEHERAIKALRNSLLFEPFAVIEADLTLEYQDIEEKKDIARKMVSMIDNNIWFLLHYISRTSDQMEILQRIQNTIVSYIKKTRIAEYTALILMEMVQIAEKTHFHYLAKKDNVARAKDISIEQLLRDQRFREKVKERAKRNEQFLQLVFCFDEQINLNHPKPKPQVRFQIQVKNRGRIKEATRKSMKKQTAATIHSRPLAHVLQEDESMEFNSDIGLFYLEYIETACKEEHIRFDARIYTPPGEESTISTIEVLV